MQKYEFLEKIGEGAFSVVYKARSYQSKNLVAIKEMKKVYRSSDDVEKFREIQALRKLSNHPNIIQLLEVVYDQKTGKLGLVFDLMKCNLFEIIDKRKHHLPVNKCKIIIYQVLLALDHFHRNGIFHRDIKPENILIDGDNVKLADCGSCRPIDSKQPFSEYISTRWYRAPECLLTDGYYSFKMDIWGLGCVFFEILMLFPLFPGKDEIDQIHRIHTVLGSPSEEYLSKIKKSKHMHFSFPKTNGSGLKKLLKASSDTLVDLLTKMLEYDADKRYTARQCLQHPFFSDLWDPNAPLYQPQAASQLASSQKAEEERKKAEEERKQEEKEKKRAEQRKARHEKQQREREEFMSDILQNQMNITRASSLAVVDLNSVTNSPQASHLPPLSVSRTQYNHSNDIPIVKENIEKKGKKKKTEEPETNSNLPVLQKKRQTTPTNTHPANTPKQALPALPPLQTVHFDSSRSKLKHGTQPLHDRSESPPAVQLLPSVRNGEDGVRNFSLLHMQRHQQQHGQKMQNSNGAHTKDLIQTRKKVDLVASPRTMMSINGVGLSPTRD
ncbi:putative MAPK/MAK/MRK overlapping kinase [Blattamonas nauphoetae]|uniref:MAPK/MAK/MRK overlapping kinase n=1 Tax=Blattamonas nauphoetae TaxID=2049346 RepID=A0ABQ9Y9H6_9EUKA|nr:putative MAPK/MAK/MRK overlapping kinase [Blattamonas nauphoetae]